MKLLIVIPARGGSKRLPNKNIQLLGGMPLLVHSIEYAKKYCIQSKIIVTTDSPYIKEIALRHGVEVVDRPIELSGDLCTTVSALQHVLENSTETFDYVVLLQPTNPLRPKTLFKEAYAKIIDGGYDSLMTVTRNEQKLGKIANNQFIPFNYKIGQRSQDLDPLYYENGLLYITKAHLILEGKIVGDNNFPYIVKHPYGRVDIDTLDDFEFAEYLIKKDEK